MLHIEVGYPNVEAELAILRLVRGEEKGSALTATGTVELLTQARREISERVRIAENMERYIVELVAATRAPKAIDAELAQWIELGASPRASLALDKVSRARAYLAGRDYVSADDVRSVAPAVLRHRLILGYEAKAKGVSADQVIARLLDRVAIAG